MVAAMTNGTLVFEKRTANGVMLDDAMANKEKLRRPNAFSMGDNDMLETMPRTPKRADISCVCCAINEY